jgi:hypothetical protein
VFKFLAALCEQEQQIGYAEQGQEIEADVHCGEDEDGDREPDQPSE